MYLPYDVAVTFFPRLIKKNNQLLIIFNRNDEAPSLESHVQIPPLNYDRKLVLRVFVEPSGTNTTVVWTDAAIPDDDPKAYGGSPLFCFFFG